jgi:hypothetical protein
VSLTFDSEDTCREHAHIPVSNMLVSLTCSHRIRVANMLTSLRVANMLTSLTFSIFAVFARLVCAVLRAQTL